MIKPPSLSVSQSPSVSSTEVYEKKETTVERKECKSSKTATSQNETKGRKKAKCEENKKIQKDYETDVSKVALKNPVACSTPPNRQRSEKKSLDKRGHKPLCKDDVPLADQTSKNSVISLDKLKGSIKTDQDLDYPTMSQKKRSQMGTKQHSVQCRLRHPSKKIQEISTSSDTDTEKGNGLKVHKYLKYNMPDFEEEKGLSSSELSMEVGSPECTTVRAMSSSQDDTEEDIQLPVVVLQKEQAAIIPGSFVWCKFQHYPYWPSLVKLVDSRNKKASVIFLEGSICDSTKKMRSFKVALRSLKPYDCPEKQQLLENARKAYDKSVDWCDSLISDYRIRLGCGSFSGSFMDYCTADISLPVRRELKTGKREALFPVMCSEGLETQEEVTSTTLPNRKLLPDRARAARDRANKTLVDFIVNAKETENHLLDILSGKKKSQWLKKFQSSKQRINCVETYIEDEEQIELVVNYLQTVCGKMSNATKKLMLGDQIRFVLEVLIPEAVIFAIASTQQMSYEQAEAKYRKGPSFTKRERRIFEEQILEKKRFKLSEEAKIKKDKKNKM
ncbi:PWWP domain-containing DNA repair factor 3A isoform 2-T4 [Leptodactylus fuscus]